MDGVYALKFARERYAYSAGDRQRGRNQMTVIKAVIDKLTSKAILNNYTGLLNSIGSSMQTNMSMDEIGDLVKMQLNDMSSWEVSTCSVDGTGLSSYTYSMPNFKAYVMVPNEATVSAAKEKIKVIMGN
jgi:anionic cell wall polymer biosynthesis LytR-Cps2A-Psr (LCP) family protein